jgi:hypothetical protein
MPDTFSPQELKLWKGKKQFFTDDEKAVDQILVGMKSNPEVHWFFYTEVVEDGKRLFKGGPHGKTSKYALVQPRPEDLKAVMQGVRKSGLLTDYMPSISYHGDFYQEILRCLMPPELRGTADFRGLKNGKR